MTKTVMNSPDTRKNLLDENTLEMSDGCTINKKQRRIEWPDGTETPLHQRGDNRLWVRL